MAWILIHNLHEFFQLLKPAIQVLETLAKAYQASRQAVCCANDGTQIILICIGWTGACLLIFCLARNDS